MGNLAKQIETLWNRKKSSFGYSAFCLYGKDYKMFSDGICRPKSAHEPNKRVCPIGKVLCPDLSCRNNNDECAESEESLGNQIRCLDQSIASDADKCPSTITCQKEDDVVCPDSTCVPNEIYCPSLLPHPEKSKAKTFIFSLRIASK